MRTMFWFRRPAASLLAALLLSCVSLAFSAAEIPDKPFAVAKVALQISDDDPAKQTLVMNVASNMLKHYGPDKAAIEIVAFGPGLRLMYADNANRKRLDGLSAEGVTFHACANTIAGHTALRDGVPPEIIPYATSDTGAIVRIMDLTKAGYVLMKP